MDYLKAFIVGGIICALVQILLEKTKMMPGRVMVTLVVSGAILGAIGLYEPFAKWAGAGATVPLLGFGNTLWKGVKEGIGEDGLLGIFKGGLTASSAGICGALVFGYLASLVFKPKMKVMTDGIGCLASGDSVSLPESGTMKDLAGALNRTSDRLARQRRQLERRDEARTEWISGVSHDIRTPLSLVMGYADMIESQPETEPEVRKKAALIRKQSLRIRDLIEDLNLASKLEYNMQPLRLNPISLAAILRRVAADLLNTIERPQDYPFSIEISQEFEEYTMEGDEQLLFRAFRNILGNSVRHNEGGCSLDINASLEHNGPVIRFYDSGIGIPREVCRYLNEGLKPEGDVHIMGLHIVKQITEAHGGKLTVKSEGHEIVVRF